MRVVPLVIGWCGSDSGLEFSLPGDRFSAVTCLEMGGFVVSSVNLGIEAWCSRGSLAILVAILRHNLDR